MDFAFSDEQRAIADLARSVFADHGSDERIRQVYESGHIFDPELWQSLAGTGLMAAILPEGVGGSGLGMMELGLILEAQGEALGPVPLWRHEIASSAIACFGSAKVQDEYLTELAEGKLVASICTDASATELLRVTWVNESWILEGLARCVAVDERTQLLVLPARDNDDRTHLFAVPMQQDGIDSVTGHYTNHEPLTDVNFSGVRLKAHARLDCEAPHDWLELRSALAISALQLGVTGEALRRAAEYTTEREQFDRSIGSFQGVAIRMADAYIQLELLRTAQWQLAWQIDRGLPALTAARLAKFQASEAGHIIGHTMQHYHGGVGADLTYPIHRYFLWSTALDIATGGAEQQLHAMACSGLPATVGFEQCLSR